MKTTLQTTAATATVLAALVLAGCHSGSSIGGSGSAVSAAAPSASALPAAPATSTPATSSTSASGTAVAAAARCPTSGLAVTIGAPQGPAGGQQTMSLVFTNTSAAACTLFGYPGVNLVQGSTQWSLQRQSAAPGKIVLRPGAHASAVLTILRWNTGDGAAFTPTVLHVTPPDETTFATVAWPHGVVILRQDEATRPGTFIGPVS